MKYRKGNASYTLKLVFGHQNGYLNQPSGMVSPDLVLAATFPNYPFIICFMINFTELLFASKTNDK